MLDHDKAGAFFAVCADRMFAQNVVGNERIEIANVELLRPVFVPQIEQFAEEIAVLLWSNGKICNPSHHGICLDARDKL